MSSGPNIPGPTLERWRDTLDACFGDQAMKELLEFRFNRNCDRDFPPNTQGSKAWVLGVMKRAAEQGWLLELLVEAAAHPVVKRSEMRDCAREALDLYKNYWTSLPLPSPPFPQPPPPQPSKS